MIKRKRVNLFNKGSKNNLTTIITEKSVLYATVVGVGLFLVFLVIIGLDLYEKNQINSLRDKQKELLTFLVENKNNEDDITYFLLKKEQVKTYTKDDAQFVPYYNVLRESLTQASNAARVDSMNIDKSKKATFIINFTDYDAMYKYIQHIESEIFLKNFESLILTTFSLNSTGQNKGYQLNFEGKFKDLSKAIQK